MAVERIIHQHLPFVEGGEHDHPGMASHRRREEEADNQMWEWRTEQVQAYERRTGYVQGDQFVPFNWETILELREKGGCE